MLIAPVVGGTKRGAARAGCRDQEWHTATGCAAIGAGAAVEAGNMSRAGSAYPYSSTSGAGRLRAEAAEDSGTALSRIQGHEADGRRGSGEILRTGLHPRGDTAGPVS